MVFRSARLVGTLLQVLPVIFLSHTLSAQSYDATADFSTTNNPSGTWTYGALDENFRSFETSPWDSSWEAWTSTIHSAANVWINRSATAEYGINPGQVALHPGMGGEPAVIRWTAPEGIGFAKIRVHGSFGSGDTGSPNLALRQASATLWSGVNSGSFDTITYVAAGDTIDFCAYGLATYANTALDAVITILEQGRGEITIDDFDRRFPGNNWITPSGAQALVHAWDATPITNAYLKAEDPGGGTWQHTWARELPLTPSNTLASSVFNPSLCQSKLQSQLHEFRSSRHPPGH